MRKQGAITAVEQQTALVAVLQAIRQAHGVSQLKVEVAMGLPINTLRHIEKGRRQLPDLQNGLSRWVKEFLACVGATPQERKLVLDVLSRQILLEFSELLDEVDQE